MTKEDAINHLSGIEFDETGSYQSYIWHKGIGDIRNEALDMAIKALDQQSSEDLIKQVYEQERWLSDAGYNSYNVDIAFKSIVKAIENVHITVSDDCVSRKAMLNAITEIDNNVNMDIYTNEVREIIKALPPVTPTHKVGYWDKTGGSFRCSECMHMPEFRDIRTLKYCPNCGAEMRGSENG